MGLIAKLLDLALLVVPVIIEWFRKRREEDESAAGYVRRKQEERLATYDAKLKGSEELTRLSRARIALARELLVRVRSVPQPSGGATAVLPEGSGVPGNGQQDVPVPSTGGGNH